jgi:hypothetical protein
MLAARYGVVAFSGFLIQESAGLIEHSFLDLISEIHCIMKTSLNEYCVSLLNFID